MWDELKSMLTLHEEMEEEKTEHHIEDEEGELFAKVRKIWDTAKREQVGQQMQAIKDRQRKAPKERRAA
jgi:hypothetical protein